VRVDSLPVEESNATVIFVARPDFRYHSDLGLRGRAADGL
jgi:hypothetical protein